MKKIVVLAVALLAFGFPPDFSFGKGGGGSSSSSSRSSSSPSPSRSSSSPSPSPSRSYSTPAPQRPSTNFDSSSQQTRSNTTSKEKFDAYKSNKQTANPAASQTPAVKTERPSTNFDSTAQKTHSDAASKEKFDAYKAGKQAPSAVADAKDRRIRELKGKLASSRIENRDLRESQFYSRYYGRPYPAYRYNDGYNILFWMWLMDRNQRVRDLWVYNHRAEMDPMRFAELKAKDANLENRLQALEQSGTARDSSYVPPGVDRDLMYTKQHVDEVLAAPEKAPEESSSHVWIWVLVGVVLLGVVVFFVPIVRRR